jgi:DNA-binding MarR family transcriptional regulator
MSRALTNSDYERLLIFRDRLRRFLHWSEQQAIEAGITPTQYQLLLAIRGHHGGVPTIRDVADHLLLRHHSVVGLIDRAETAGLVERRVDKLDHRVVRLHLTNGGSRLLATLASAHLHELSRLEPLLLPRSRPTGLTRRPVSADPTRRTSKK